MWLTGLTSLLEPPEFYFLSLLRHLTYETVFNPCFLSGVTLKLYVSPQVVSVGFLASPGVPPLFIKETENPGEILSKFQEASHCRDCIPLRNHLLWGSVQ